MRRVRPNFAEDVYGANAASSKQEEHDEVDDMSPDMCESALAQRRSAQLPKLKEIGNNPRPLSGDLSGAYMDFVDERHVTVDGTFEAHDPVNNVGTEDCEEKCLSEGILNAYKAYEFGTYQVTICERRGCRRSATMADNEALRVVLSALYHMIESIRRKDLFDLVVPADKRARYAQLREDFISEVGVVRPKRTLHPSARLIFRQLACSDSVEDKSDGSSKTGIVAANIDRLEPDLGLSDQEKHVSESIAVDVDDITKKLMLDECPRFSGKYLLLAAFYTFSLCYGASYREV
ncbi:unnamed protein product [Gongylonema pulchrum]|uniref:Apple domain-containing protein n=1 Tax=Gongylonema pulchrum TaxID=637853 RepID=A0A183DXE2_9BILA|nr:unnamed protein product [Gongylonema pulchrum]